MATAGNDLKVVTGKVRLSFVHLFEPYSSDPEKTKKYSCTILIPKSDKKTIKAIEDAQLAALEAGKGKLGGKIPPNWSNTLHDGDEDRDTEQYPEYEGNMYMDVSANIGYPPVVVDRQVRPILDPSEVYSGCYARVSMVAFVYNTAGKKGVSFCLRNVQKLEDGEALAGGRSDPEEDFDALEGDDLI